MGLFPYITISHSYTYSDDDISIIEYIVIYRMIDPLLNTLTTITSPKSFLGAVYAFVHPNAQIHIHHPLIPAVASSLRRLPVLTHSMR